ncbi:MAG: ABC transporter ATP-binding protein [Litorilinea sp.]|nr:MAG: ABC transporter ATP-binding protein [Litorilinea sp.]
MSEWSDAEPPSHRPPILVAHNLHKAYGQRPALRGVSFMLESGHVLGFLGPNGAGKTTAIRILTTILVPDVGDFQVNGIGAAQAEEIRRLIGVLPERLGLPKHLTGIEYLTYFGQLYGQSAARARQQALRLLDEVGLANRARSLIGTYSHGMRQRLGIARALVNNPAVVFLDEPTLGLDPRGQEELLTLVRRIARERQAGIVLCSHLLSEVEVVCDDVLILNAGQVVAAGPVTEVVGHGRRQELQASVRRIQVPAHLMNQAQHVLTALPEVLYATPTGDTAGWIRVQLALPTNLMDGRQGVLPADTHLNNRILAALIAAEIPVLSFGREGGRLHDVFLQLTGEAIP